MAELVVGSIFAGHRLDAIAGRGGMGVVFRATDLELQRTVALKVIAPALTGDEGFVMRFQREARLAASIRNPHVLPVYRAGEDEGRLFVTMEFVDGVDLGAWIAEGGPLESSVAARIVAHTAAGLDAAHAQGLVHRDVKPANILIEQRSDGPHAYLTDFGLTRPQGGEGTALTATGIVVGTVDYMAPEQLVDGDVDARTDVYALGCVLFQAVTGRVPYPQDTPIAKMHAHANLPVPSINEVASGLSPAFDAVIQRAMAKDPSQRFLSAGDLGRAAMAAAGGVEPTLVEHSVATGQAAFVTGPTQALGARQATMLDPRPGEHAAEPRHGNDRAGERRRRTPVAAALAGLAAVLVTGGIVAALLLGGADGSGEDSATNSNASGTPTTSSAAGPSPTPTTVPPGPPASVADGLTPAEIATRIARVRECFVDGGWVSTPADDDSGHLTTGDASTPDRKLSFYYDRDTPPAGQVVHYQNDDLLVTMTEPSTRGREEFAYECIKTVT